MFEVGTVSQTAKQLIQVTKDCLYLAISLVKAEQNLKNIGKVISHYAKIYNYSVVEDFCGHGIGSLFHEPNFQVLHYENSYDFILKENMTFTIEPMLNIGKKHTKILEDAWTAVTKDHSLSAQWEHTLAVTKTGCEILTIRKNENIQPSTKARLWLNDFLTKKP